MARKGDWIETYTGKRFYPFDPRPEEIDIMDIAHALSNICRFNGHCKRFYSVAEHSARMSMHVGTTPDSLFALLHDAHEAYLMDVPRPVKAFTRFFGHSYEVWANLIQTMIYEKYGLDPFNAPVDLIRQLDATFLFTEGRDLMTNAAQWEGFEEARLIDGTIHPWLPGNAKVMFLQQFKMLFPVHARETAFE